LSSIDLIRKLAGDTLIDVMFVAYGHPNQEKWIARNLKKVPVKVAIGVGGTFDYIIGQKKRAPHFILNSSFEWLYKLVTQPWRMRRVIKAFPEFPLRVFFESIGS